MLSQALIIVLFFGIGIEAQTKFAIDENVLPKEIGGIRN